MDKSIGGCQGLGGLRALSKLENHFERVSKDFGARVECNGEEDHVHVLVQYPPKVSGSALVRSMKGVLGRVIRKQPPDLAKHDWKAMLWSPSYFAASCGGARLDIIKAYVEQHHRPE